MSARGYRASLLWFPDPALPVAQWEEDGLLVVAPDAQGREVVQAIGDWRTLSALNCRLPVEHLPGRIIAPGFVDTELTRRVLGDAGIEALVAGVPARRMGHVDEIARLVLWLASDENTYLTGQNIAIDGGFTRV